MRTRALAVLAAAIVAAGGAVADERYDRKLDEAAAGIVAARMGALRTGFAPDERPVLVDVAPEATPEASKALPAPAPGEWRDGLAIAVERRSDVSPEL